MRIINIIPMSKITWLACSGGVDSMVLLHFLNRNRANNRVGAAYFNHGTEHGSDAENFLKAHCRETNTPLQIGRIEGSKPSDQSQEEWWRNQRYQFLSTLPTDGFRATAHHLNDVAETYLWSSIHGKAKLIPYQNESIVRPLLVCSKQDIARYAIRNNVSWIEDASNAENIHVRNIIRNQIMPHVLEVNAGFLTVIRKKIEYEISRVTAI